MTKPVRNLGASATARLLNQARESGVDFQTLAESVRRTFGRRSTPITETTPIGLSQEYWSDPARPAQLRAFARRAGIELPDANNEPLSRLISAFLLPILEDVRLGRRFKGSWRPGGPWHEGNENPS